MLCIPKTQTHSKVGSHKRWRVTSAPEGSNISVLSSVAVGYGALSHGLAASAEGAAVPSEEDVRSIQGALNAFERLGEYPSNAALKEAERQLTEAFARWQALEVSRAEKSAILRLRAVVRRRQGKLDEAFEDLNAAVKVMDGVRPSSAEGLDELPKLYIARAEAWAAVGKWNEALADYDRAADVLGEPLEEPPLLIGRAAAKQELKQMAAAAADFEAAAEVLHRFGKDARAEIAAERAGIALLGAGEASVNDAGTRLCGVIKRTIGLVSKEVKDLQEVVVADVDARVAMAAISWHQGKEEVAEAYWVDACDRLERLYNDTTKMTTTENGFPNGVSYLCSRYATETAWLRSDRHWPENVVDWFVDFMQKRSGTPPRADYLQDLVVGKRPGDGSNFAEVLQARDEFRKVRGPFKLPDMDDVERQGRF
eukprot:TRINITY_DN24685_c0_g1_i3.p1 TRINITY_DN24685_c0_g1~~TRINITY_DN24685_c0_g1_i3.p1  ORF type:complete len:425 (+),score=105.30 TRINITY_DN24685_c0_g1_i3:270-1544(+)